MPIDVAAPTVSGVRSSKRLLYHRLLGAGRPAHRPLRPRIAAQERVDLHQFVCSSHDGDKPVVEFVERRLLHRFLRDPHPRPDRRAHVALPQQHA